MFFIKRYVILIDICQPCFPASNPAIRDTGA